jgi:Phage capsid family
MGVKSLHELDRKGAFLSHSNDPEPDFSGWATKAGLKCTDGRTIMAEAFKHQDKVKVPLVWQHGHNDPENVLGHAILEARPEGMYAYGYFNKSAKAKHTHDLLIHKDINFMSIWANDLVERAKRVLHGAIREVSLVLSGANPGAIIENVTIRHSDDTEEELDEEAIIYTGLEIKHADDGSGKKDDGKKDDGKKTGDETVQDVIDSMSEKQQEVLHYMIGEALSAAGGEAKHDNTGKKGGKVVKHNVFDQNDTGKKKDEHVLSHEDIKGIVADAMKGGSLKQAVEAYALQHGIENMGILFPEAKNLEGGPPSFITREMAWVSKVFGGASKSPFARVKTRSADLTFEEARAKGYIKGNLKKEEFFAVAQRETTPQTIYKKQKLDRDDMIDITDFDVVAWLKGEMRLMLNEELARAILVGDGRDAGSDDKIREDKIRPIASDDPFYTVTVNVNLGDANSTVEEVLDAIILNRQYYKGSGNPTMFTTETFISQVVLLRDAQGRKLYRSIDEVRTDLRVESIVPVEILDGYPDISAILVNMTDYNVGADRGGEVNLFDDFDIDYNQYKYLIETRCSGALTRPRSAMVVRTTTAGDTAATAGAPTWNAATHTVTIPADADVDYVNAETGAALADGDHVLDPGDVLTVRAVPTAGNYLTNVKVEWSYMRPTGS